MTPARIPADAPLGGAFWTVVVPLALLLFSAWATWRLYRHFAGKGGGDRR